MGLCRKSGADQRERLSNFAGLFSYIVADHDSPDLQLQIDICNDNHCGLGLSYNAKQIMCTGHDHPQLWEQKHEKTSLEQVR